MRDMDQMHGTRQTRPRTAGPRCAAKTRSGTPCQNPAGMRTEHVGYGTCYLHGGCMPNHVLAAARAEAHQSAAVFMGPALDVEPHEALLWCIRLAAGQVEYAQRRVAGLRDDDAFEETVGGRQLTAWVRVQQESMERLARFSKMALDAGVEERRVRLSERFGEAIASVLDGGFKDLGLSADQQRRAPDIVQRALLAMERTV